jgi:AcrR family transcriptional regulator
MAQILAKTGRRLPADRRREHLLDVAAQILVEEGFDAFSMEAVKARAGVSRGLAYVHFANADELAFALYEREVKELDRRIVELGHTGGTFEERVTAAIKTYLDFAAERGGLLALLQVKLSGRWSQPSVREALARRFGFWSDEIEREFGVPASVAGALARATLTGVEAFAAAWRMKKLKRQDAERMAVAFAIGGVGAAAAARARAG